MKSEKLLPTFETETEDNCDFKKFDFTKLHDYTHEDYKWFLKIIASISMVLCIHQYESTEGLYRRIFAGEEHVPENAMDIFVMAIHFCRKHGIIGNITPEQIAFQVNSLSYPIKSDKEMRAAINHY
jgi:hypothetical protein